MHYLSLFIIYLLQDALKNLYTIVVRWPLH